MFTMGGMETRQFHQRSSGNIVMTNYWRHLQLFDISTIPVLFFISPMCCRICWRYTVRSLLNIYILIALKTQLSHVSSAFPVMLPKHFVKGSSMAGGFDMGRIFNSPNTNQSTVNINYGINAQRVL